MKSWLRISLLLCVFGFLKEIRPSEPFVTDFLIQPWRNVTIEEVNRYVFPTGTYSTLVLLTIVLLITDYLRYKPVIIMLGIAGIVTYSLLLWTTEFVWLQVIQVCYAMYIATEVAYFTYIYAKVSKEHYLIVTSHSRAALLAGKFLSGVIGQVLVKTGLMNIRQLNYITLGAQIGATFVGLMLPRAEQSIYFNRMNTGASLAPISTKRKFRSAFHLIKAQVLTAYGNPDVVLWSMWYAFGVCGYFQVWNYVQMLWTAIDDDPTHIWNGAVEAGTTLVCAGVALLASRLHENVFKTRTKLIGLLFTQSAFLSVAVFLMSTATHRYSSYAGYTIFYICYTFTVTISSAEIAKHLADDSYGLIFGINTFIALILQSILTALVVSDAAGLNLNIFQQFTVYAIYFAILGCSYLVMLAFHSVGSSRPTESIIETTDVATERSSTEI